MDVDGNKVCLELLKLRRTGTNAPEMQFLDVFAQIASIPVGYNAPDLVSLAKTVSFRC